MLDHPQKIKAQALLEEFAAGTIDRRHLLKGLLTLGISAPSAYVLMGEMAASAAETPFTQEFTKPPFELQKKFDDLRQVITSKRVLEVLDKMANEGDAEKAKDAHRLYQDILQDPSTYQFGTMTPPKDMLRISMRVFDTTPAYKEIYSVTPQGRPDAATICVSAGLAIVCVSCGW
jgi:hypothetical protein